MAQPLGHGHAHGVAHAPIAVTVGDLLAVGSPAIPVVGKALQSVTFARREPPHAGARVDRHQVVGTVTTARRMAVVTIARTHGIRDHVVRVATVLLADDAWQIADADVATVGRKHEILGLQVHAIARLTRHQRPSHAVWLRGVEAGEVGGVPGVADPSASLWRASCKREGNVLPLRSARRRMPAAALADSQYRRGTGLVSKTADNEHATATLGHSEVTRVQNSVRPPVPELAQAHENAGKVPSTVGGKQSGNILNDAPAWPQFGQDAFELKPERAALAG